FEVRDSGLSVALDMDGFALNASVELGMLILQAARFELESEEIFNSRLEDSISTFALGLNFYLPRSSIYGLIKARNDDLSLRGGGFDEDADGTSVGAEIGARFNVTDRVELNAKIGRPSEDAGNSYGVGGQFFVTDNIGITLDFESIEIEDSDIKASFDSTTVGLRYNF
ncbi:MAG: hypothetical protein KJP04_05430, partial [Arenicella sp.]|nr:hypothetical protein [Arenicella sp.]